MRHRDGPWSPSAYPIDWTHQLVISRRRYEYFSALGSALLSTRGAISELIVSAAPCLRLTCCKDMMEQCLHDWTKACTYAVIIESPEHLMERCCRAERRLMP